ncbi:GNAT family N-acetyltransferase [Glycomyces terrestris]|uniref:GNAT family N-acetyltransferase n=1 Tax=Glycomyces terrestris TaxID=2493553 RepID=A0A426UUI6_9ACTN|nr:GNAT family N-acetyltransferase [Glycomyces terrestris]RRR97645.1 GNAT family N-acetyltransferase [Glycomyces terrestris]
MEPVTLDADGLRLTAWEQRHVPDLARIYADPLIERFLVMPLPWTGPARDRFVATQRRHWEAGNPRWAVEEDGRLVGSMALTKSFPGEMTITYVTAPWARGRGVAQRGIRAAVAFGFERFGARRIAWDAIVGNHASRLAALRTGFTVEGIARGGVNQRGASRDCWVGGMLPGGVRGPDDPPPHYAVLKRQAAFFTAAQPELETGAAGLRLRALRRADLDDVAAACADERTQRYTTVPRGYTRADAEAWLETCRRMRDEGAGVVYALADEHDRYSGSVQLSLREPGEAEVGYHAAPWARGRGWTTAALRRVGRLGFEELGLEKIDWRAVVGNEASRRVAEKAGFTVEGTRRRVRHGQDGRVEMWIGSLLPEDLA